MIKNLHHFYRIKKKVTKVLEFLSTDIIVTKSVYILIHARPTHHYSHILLRTFKPAISMVIITNMFGHHITMLFQVFTLVHFDHVNNFLFEVQCPHRGKLS